MLEIQELLEECLESYPIGSKDLVQLRGQEREVTLFALKNGFLEECSKNYYEGIGIRALANKKAWGFTSTNFLDPQNVNGLLDTAFKLARTASSHKNKITILDTVECITDSVSVPCEKSPNDYSPEEISQVVIDAHQGAKDVSSEIKNIDIKLIIIQDQKYFHSSEGSEIQEGYTKLELMVNVLGKRYDKLIPASETFAHTGGMELFDQKSPEEMGKSVSEGVMNLLDAKECPSGILRVLISPSLCATLLHEAIGHPLEADLAMAGGGFSGLIGELVSSELVTIYDSGLVERGLGYFTYDDEGVRCKRTNLLKDGILESYMHDRTSAAIQGVEPTGNSHAWDFSVEPLIRQTNIGLQPGDFTSEELIQDIEKGLYLDGTFGGQADTNGDFTFGFQNARQITNGELGEHLLGANVSGNAIEVFKTIDAISNKSILRPGACGKGQFAIQGRIAPAIRCNIMVGGKGG